MGLSPLSYVFRQGVDGCTRPELYDRQVRGCAAVATCSAEVLGRT